MPQPCVWLTHGAAQGKAQGVVFHVLIHVLLFQHSTAHNSSVPFYFSLLAGGPGPASGKLWDRYLSFGGKTST